MKNLCFFAIRLFWLLLIFFFHVVETASCHLMSCLSRKIWRPTDQHLLFGRFPPMPVDSVWDSDLNGSINGSCTTLPRCCADRGSSMRSKSYQNWNLKKQGIKWVGDRSQPQIFGKSAWKSTIEKTTAQTYLQIPQDITPHFITFLSNPGRLWLVTAQQILTESTNLENGVCTSVKTVEEIFIASSASKSFWRTPLGEVSKANPLPAWSIKKNQGNLMDFIHNQIVAEGASLETMIFHCESPDLAVGMTSTSHDGTSFTCLKGPNWEGAQAHAQFSWIINSKKTYDLM